MTVWITKRGTRRCTRYIAHAEKWTRCSVIRRNKIPWLGHYATSKTPWICKGRYMCATRYMLAITKARHPAFWLIFRHHGVNELGDNAWQYQKSYLQKYSFTLPKLKYRVVVVNKCIQCFYKNAYHTAVLSFQPKEFVISGFLAAFPFFRFYGFIVLSSPNNSSTKQYE